MSQKPQQKEPTHKMVRHAKRELTIAQLFGKREDYDGSLGPATLSMIKTFVRVTRGDPARMETVFNIFSDLTHGELLSWPTTDPKEWKQIPDSKPMTWHNIRSQFYRSTDHGVTYYRFDDPERVVRGCKNHITGEVPTDEPTYAKGLSEETTAIQENTERSGDGENAGESTAAEESDSNAPSGEGRGGNDGVAAQSPEDPQQPENAQTEPEAGQES